MGGYHRQPFDGIQWRSRATSCAPLPPGTRVLSNSVVAPGAKLLAKDGWQVAVLDLDAPTDRYAFDTVIVSPSDAPAAISASQAPGAGVTPAGRQR